MCAFQSGASSVDGTCCGLPFGGRGVLSVTRGHRVATRDDPDSSDSRVTGVQSYNPVYVSINYSPFKITWHFLMRMFLLYHDHKHIY